MRIVQPKTAGRAFAMLLAAFAWRCAGAAPPAPATPSAAADADNSLWTKYQLGQRDDITITLQVRKSASLAQNDWLQIIIENAGPKTDITPDQGYVICMIKRAEISDKSTGKALRIVDLAPSPVLDPWTGPGVPRPAIPAGNSTIIFKPSAQAAFVLGRPGPNVTWHVHATVDFKLSLHYDFRPGLSDIISTPSGGVPVDFDWRAPSSDELKAAVVQTHDILKSEFKNDHDTDFLLPTFLSIKEVGDSISVEDAIAAMQRQGGQHNPMPENSEIFRSRFALYRFVAARWPQDPKLVTFIAGALPSKDSAAVALELLSLRQAPWDDSFVEPLLQALEADGPRSDANFARFAVAILEKHAGVWAGNRQFVARAGKVIQDQWAGHLDPSDARFREALDAFATSRDPQVIATLRPLLDNKTVVYDARMSQMANSPPSYRACDLAYSAIATILGIEDNLAVDREGIALRNESAQSAATLEIWNRWDKAIDELKVKIDKR